MKSAETGCKGSRATNSGICGRGRRVREWGGGVERAPAAAVEPDSRSKRDLEIPLLDVFLERLAENLGLLALLGAVQSL